MIHITEKATDKVKELSDGEGIGHYTIRAKVIGGGCAGFSYDLAFDDSIGELDEVVEQDGVKVVTDPMSMQYLEDVVIDWVETISGGGFKFHNPNATGSCGCGSSFSV